MGCDFLLQGVFLTQGSNPCLLHLLHWQADSLPLSHLGNHVLDYTRELSRSVVSDSATPWIATRQAPLSMEILQPIRLEYSWSGLSCPPPGDLPNPEIEPRSPALQVDFLPAELPREAHKWYHLIFVFVNRKF